MSSPGDVGVLDFPGATGVKRRPGVVVSSDVYHAHRPDLIVGLITSRTAAAICPTDHALRDWAAAGLRVPSAFRSYLITVARSASITRIGRLSDDDWRAVRACLAAALAQPAPTSPP